MKELAQDFFKPKIDNKPRNPNRKQIPRSNFTRDNQEHYQDTESQETEISENDGKQNLVSSFFGPTSKNKPSIVQRPIAQRNTQTSSTNTGPKARGSFSPEEDDEIEMLIRNAEK